MDIHNIISNVSRVLFVLAIAILAVAFVEIAVNIFGYTITRGLYTAGRLLEMSAPLLIFVITILVRQIRDTMRARAG